MEKATTTQILTTIKEWVLGKIADVWALIPSQASTSNQLADKAFVNSSIATATATFRGTYNLVSDLSLTTSATQQQIAAAIATEMAALGITPDSNDYAFVQVPTDDATPTEIAHIDRYKYNGSIWEFEYTLNNSGFTAEQWAAINSGVTSGDMTKLRALPTSAELTALLDGKQNVIQDLAAIRSGASAGTTAVQPAALSAALVQTVAESGVFDLSAHNAVNGVLTTYADLSAALTALNALSSEYKKPGMSFKFVLTDDNKYVQFRYMGTAVTGSPNPFLDTANWQGVDAEPTAGSNNLVKSGGVEKRFIAELKPIDIINDTYIHSNGNLYASSVGVSVVVFDISNFDVSSVNIHVNKSGNSSTRLYGFGKAKKQLKLLIPSTIIGNSSALTAEANVVDGYDYLYVCCFEEDGYEVKFSLYSSNLKNGIDRANNNLLDLSSKLYYPDTVDDIVVTNGKVINGDGSITNNSNYTLYEYLVGENDAVFNVSNLRYGDSNISTIAIYNNESQCTYVFGKVEAATINIADFKPYKIACCSYNRTPQFQLKKLGTQNFDEEFDALHNEIDDIENSIKLESIFIANYFWTSHAVGEIATLTSSNEWVASKKIKVKPGDTIKIWGKGGSNSSRLWAVLDAENVVIQNSDAGVKYNIDNPLSITIDNANAKYFIASFSKYTYYGISSDALTMGQNIYQQFSNDQYYVNNYAPKVNGILLTGASFAFSANSWFSTLCGKLRSVGYNKAVSGTSIIDTAKSMHNGELYSATELENFDIFMIMHVHNQNVADTQGIEEDYNDYTDFDNMTYAQAYDYVLKKYSADCYALKNNPNSKWYNYPMGKPCIIVVLTHWHDSRTIFNDAIRTLKDKWGFHLVELDKNIGFSKNEPNPSTLEQTSILYAVDTETINGVVYGWHPLRSGNGSNVIQGKIAQLCYDTIVSINHNII